MHTKDWAKQEAKSRCMRIADVIDAAAELWIRSDETDRRLAVGAAVKRRDRFLKKFMNKS